MPPADCQRGQGCPGRRNARGGAGRRRARRRRPARPHVLPKAGTALDIPIKDLGNFEFDAEKGGNIPADVKKLEGCRFRTTGYMVPLDQAESISNFALVPSLFACCFGQPPQIQHTDYRADPQGKSCQLFPR